MRAGLVRRDAINNHSANKQAVQIKNRGVENPFSRPYFLSLSHSQIFKSWLQKNRWMSFSPWTIRYHGRHWNQNTIFTATGMSYCLVITAYY